jgi:hypothetical protein
MTIYFIIVPETCRSIPFAVAISLTLSIENQTKAVFNVYPNPATDLLNIETVLELKSVEIYNIQGQRVLKSNKKQINISKLYLGMYMLNICDMENNIFIKKL